MTVDEFIDSVANDITDSINTLIKREDFYDDIVITGTPNDMIFEGINGFMNVVANSATLNLYSILIFRS